MKPTSSDDHNSKDSRHWLLPLVLTILTGLGIKLIWQNSGHTILAIWNWLWGMPINSGGKIAVEAARNSVQSMQQSVAQITESVATAVAAYEKVKTKYIAKQQEFKQAESQALVAYQQGNEEAARLAMTRAIAIERLLPKMGEQVTQTEKVVVAAKEKLYREREKLEAYQIEMQNMKVLAEINEALETITQVDSSLDINSARYQFESAQEAVEERYLKANAHVELSENPTKKLQTDLDHLMLNDEISRRLAQLKAEQS